MSMANQMVRLAASAVISVVGGLVAATSGLALGGAASGRDSALQPHLVMVLSKQGIRNGACTGTVIARDIIITAAHCVAGNKQIVVAYAENGSHILQRISGRAINPGYSGKSNVSIDLALVRLEGDLPARFQPVRLDKGEGEHRVGQSQVIAGFGLQRDNDEASAGTLRSAQVSVFPRLYPRFLRLGTRAEATLSDFAICTGDSGGPVFESGSEGPLLVGVVYGREKFGNAESCGITAQAVRIAPQRGWIDGTIARWSRGPVARPSRPGSLAEN